MDLQQPKAIALKHAEAMAKEMVEVCLEPALLEGKEKLKAAIPGQVDDMVLDLVFGALQAPLKAALLAQIEKISAE